ncbi:ABC transporter permease [Fulvivirgaceae bacterium BMA10]|uniref:ABC transporter permease n=1 Tax=Splendidivirga corallicola TaxID=3051826 RepID=A0ABT8KTS4_9BACT|nr:ABC transporter permease [Fulvivirgaceae bacterium BMA10]
MIKNYLKVAFRSIVKNKVYSVLNILGLTIGMTCSIIIFLYVHDELTFDKFHEKSDQIYRLGCEYFLPNDAGSEINATMGPVVGKQMVQDYAEILQAVRIQRRDDHVVQKAESNERFFETIHFADSNLFDLFTFPLIDGDPDNALREPYTMVISQKVAMKYFDRLDVVGEELLLPEDSLQFKITGVLADIPANSHLQFDFLASLQTRYSQGAFMTGWWNFNTYSYLELEKNTNVAALSEKIIDISRRYIADQEDGSGYRQAYFLQHLEDIHLYSDLRYEISANNKASYVYIFLVIGIFILIIACINFMNLATARSALRAKEVGLRKVVGAYRHQLMVQFLSESIIMAVISLCLSMILVFFGLNTINGFTGKNLALDFLGNPLLPITIVAITLFVGVLSGSYPSIFLSSFKPSETLKGSFKSSAKGNILRKVLVVFQFTVSIILITGTIVVFNQLHFMRDRDLGFDKARTIFIPTRFVNNASANFRLLKESLEKYPQVLGASLSSRVPGKELNNSVVRLGWDENAEWSDMRYLTVDHDFIEQYDLEVLEGRPFSEEHGTDVEEAFILNESGMKRLGWADPQEAIGKQLRWQRRNGHVIGIVKDFHFMSVNRAIDPFIITMQGDRAPGYLSVKLVAEDYQNSIELIRKEYKSIMPSGIFEYEFLDRDFDQQYKSDEKFMTIFTFFAIIAILVACLGLYGLAAFTAELKTKEMGIRKVLGASLGKLLILITTQFSKLVILAIFISVPLAYFGLAYWLEGFPYKTSLSWWIFVLSGLTALIIAWLTISYQSVKSALVNPVDSLRQE